MLALVHLLLLSVIAIYLSTSLAGVTLCAVLVVAVAVISELLPVWLRRSLLPEFLLTVVLAACWLWAIPTGSRDALHGLVGLAFSAWVLIPARRGSLQWLAVLAAGELLLASQRGDSGRAVLWMVPIAIIALAAEAWFSVRLGAVIPVQGRSALRRSRLRWLVLPALMVIGLALIAGPPLTRQAAGIRERLLATGEPKPAGTGSDGGDPLSVGLAQCLDVGGTTSIEPDNRIAARLLFDGDPEPLGMVYLRALALGEVQLDQGRIRWHPAGLERLTTISQAQMPSTSKAWIYRATGCGDVVLLPDGAERVALDGLKADREGNLYRSRLGEAPRIYQTDLAQDATPALADVTAADRYRRVPPLLDALPWERIADPAWVDMPVEQAAESVARRLAARCRYGLTDLPTPPAVAGGALRLFLFGNDEQRRGHCQYFTTATVLLLRRAGHQARCVAGFASNEYDERGVVFRGLHAHAWVEIVDRTGRWQRVDPTPAAERKEILASLTTGSGMLPDPEGVRDPNQLPPPVEFGKEGAWTGHSPRGWMMALGALLLVSIWWWARRLARPTVDPRRTALRRHTDELLQLAMELGLPVRASTTLTQVCAALQARTGIDLARPLAQHLAARYGEGNLPGPWPLDALRAAALQRGSPQA